jgi:hypothetical protein
MGASGHNAAQQVLRDARLRRARGRFERRFNGSATVHAATEA